MSVGRAAWLVVPVLGVAEALAFWGFDQRAPDADEWSSLPALVGRVRGPGDLIVVAPAWAEPIARQVLGETVMPLEDIARADTSAYRTALEVSILSASSDEVASFRQLSVLQEGAFRLRRLENPNHRPVRYRFDDWLRPEALEVTEGAGAARTPCEYTAHARPSAGGLGGHTAYPRERFECAGGEPFFVGLTVIDDQNYRPRRCIFAHPPAGGGSLQLDFSRVPAGTAIKGYAGLPYLLFRDGVGTPVTLVAFVNDVEVGRVVHRDEAGFAPFEFPIPEMQRREGRVRFEISTDDPSNREFCFTADVR